jgi:hypothetical protein
LEVMIWGGDGAVVVVVVAAVVLVVVGCAPADAATPGPVTNRTNSTKALASAAPPATKRFVRTFGRTNSSCAQTTSLEADSIGTHTFGKGVRIAW